jgi:hypothetical protein
METENKRSFYVKFAIVLILGILLGSALGSLIIVSFLKPQQLASPVPSNIYNGTQFQGYSPPASITEAGKQVGTADYIIFADGKGNYYAKSGDNGSIVFSGTDASTVIQRAIDAELGKWGTVWLKGYFTLSKGITLWSGVGLRGAKAGWGDSAGSIKIEDGLYGNFNEPIVTIKNHPSYSSIKFFPYIGELAIIGGGNANYTSNHGIYVSDENGAPMDIFIRNVLIGWCGGNGLHVYSGSKMYVSDFYSESNKQYGVYVDKSAILEISRAYIYGNRKSGIYYNAHGGGGYLNIMQNIIFNNGYYGVEVYSTTKGSIQIIGNMFIQNDAYTSYADIELSNVPHYTMIGNMFFDYRSPKLTKYHIKLEGNSNGVITGNVFFDTAVNGVFYFNPRGSSIIENNLGYTTKNSGTATFSGNGTTKQFTIAHGLAGTPTTAIVTPASSDATGSFYVTVDATYIYVNYVTAPPAGTNNVVLNWYAELS